MTGPLPTPPAAPPPQGRVTPGAKFPRIGHQDSALFLGFLAGLDPASQRLTGRLHSQRFEADAVCDFHFEI